MLSCYGNFFGDPDLGRCLAEEGEGAQLASPALKANCQPDFAQIVRTTAPVIFSDSFKRLRKITFLGILSPRFSGVERHPIQFSVSASDRNRASHSLRVALLAGKISENLSFSPKTIRYAILWGLLHDLATWPLSHTGEAAFSGATSVSAGELRRMMIKGDRALHRSLSLYSALKDIAVDIDLVLALFEKKANFGASEFGQLHQLLHSALTPDTLEGMHRSGGVFGLSVPDPKDFVDSMERDLVSGVRLKRSFSTIAIAFWRAKGKIYSDFINKEETVVFESAWSAAIRDVYAKVDLSESLFADEVDIIRNASIKQIKSTTGVVRYKAPLTYRMALKYSATKKFKDSLPLEYLSEIFVKDKA